jgi:hypothetical protein
MSQHCHYSKPLECLRALPTQFVLERMQQSQAAAAGTEQPKFVG